MTLKEMKVKTFSLIEEYYPDEPNLAEDEDVINKINGVVNQIQMDLMRYRKMPANTEIEINENDDHIIDLSSEIKAYQINKIILKATNGADETYEMIDDVTLEINEDFVGTIRVFYYRLPKLCKVTFDSEDERQEEDENFTFDLDSSLLEIMPYGIAADLLKMDMISSYGTYFYNRYLELRNSIDSRRTVGSIRFEGGIDV